MIQAGKTTKPTTRKTALCALGSVVLGATLATTMGGCRGDRTDKRPRQFFPDMDDQPKLKAQSQSEFYEDGHSQRLPVAGTVAFGDHALVPDADEDLAWVKLMGKDRNDKLRADETYYFGLVSGSTDQYVARMPVEVNQELIERGQERFNIYCSMCHGYDAKGGDSGTVGRLMNVRPVNLLDEKYRDRSGEFGADGYIFHIIRQGLWTPDGKNRMPSYGHAVKEQDAWAIVSYIRTLQAAFDPDGQPISQGASSEPVPVEPEQAVASTNDGGEG